MDVQRLDGKTVLVTGAASGIGRASALAFAARGADLALCDVDESGLADTERRIRALGREVLAKRVDVAAVPQMLEFAEAVHARVEAVDILMNNAGVALGAGFLDTTLEDWDWILGINLRGVILGCHFFVPRMVKRGRGGHVINVSSAAGYIAPASLAAYSTTKFAVLGLSEALRDELAPQGIGVTAVCPGVINTPITQSARLRGPGDPEEMRRYIVQTYGRRNYGPERVAEGVLKAVQRNRAVAPITPEAWVLYYLQRLAPWLVRWIHARVGERNRKRFSNGAN